MPVHVSDDRRIFSFERGMTPAVEVDPGETVVFDTRDCYDGRVDLDAAQLSDQGIVPSWCNPATGPVFVRGAMPGDMLVVRIESVQCAPRGLIFGASRDGACREGRVIRLADGFADLPGNLRVPLDPVIGVIGVAPAGEPVPTVTPGDHGGNLDTTDVKTGNTVYLPVSEPGAMFALGDVHALQGDGEVCGQGIEAAARVTVNLQVMKGSMSQGPLIKTPTHWAVVASGVDLDAAVDLALLRARDFLLSRVEVKDHQAPILLSTLCDVRIGQIVNPLKTVRVCIPTRVAGTW